MKKFLIVLLLVPLISFAQNKKEYKASNGITYHPGDTIKLGTGSAPNGSFRFIQDGGWKDVEAYDPNRSTGQFNVDKNSAQTNVVIKKISALTGNGATKVIFTVKGENTPTSYLFIEEAVQSCEIADCNKTNPRGTASKLQ
ncbi:MAG: hypothetical protein C5B59_13255 [Bacteroidetes bacterium]|nr:MAG: hypothetical protein C5B59_13255 [Bacteroidota bacterium]